MPLISQVSCLGQITSVAMTKLTFWTLKSLEFGDERAAPVLGLV